MSKKNLGWFAGIKMAPFFALTLIALTNPEKYMKLTRLFISIGMAGFAFWYTYPAIFQDLMGR